MKSYRLLVLSLCLSLAGLARSAEPVFDTHVHLRDGETSLQKFEAEAREAGIELAGVGAMGFGGPDLLRHPSGFVLDRAAEIAVVEAGWPQAGRDSPHHRDAQIDLSDGRLHSIDDITGRLELAQAAHCRHEIELDARQKLAELVMQLARDARTLLLAHLLESLGKGGIQVGIGRDGKLQPGAFLTRSRVFVNVCRISSDNLSAAAGSLDPRLHA